VNERRSRLPTKGENPQNKGVFRELLNRSGKSRSVRPKSEVPGSERDPLLSSTSDVEEKNLNGKEKTSQTKIPYFWHRNEHKRMGGAHSERAATRN